MLDYDLAYNALCADTILTAEERFFIVESLEACRENIVPLAGLYLKTGCLDMALPLLEEVQDWRGIGEVFLMLGDENQALQYFQKPKKGENDIGRYRYGPDHDHILRILFKQQDWDGLLNAFKAANISHLADNKIILRGVAVSSKTWLKMIAITLANIPSLHGDKEFYHYVMKTFNISDDELQKTVEWAKNLSHNEILQEIEKLRSKITRINPKNFDEAMALGHTEKAKTLLKWIQEVSIGLTNIQKAVNGWLLHGNEDDLNYAVDLITRSDYSVMTQSVFFEVTNRTNILKGSPDRVIKFYQSHEHIFRLCFGHYLKLNIKLGGCLSEEDLLTAIFQYMAWPQNINDVLQLRFSIKQLVSCEEWALLKLNEWKSHDGKSLVAFAENEIINKADEISDTRRLASWVNLSKSATWWLEGKWKEEIAISPWVSENLLYTTMKYHFPNFEVIQHARPAWLSPQHLDIYIPEISLAIEYMGLQHYESIGFFGGDEGLLKTVERDKRKQLACNKAGIELIYVRFDQNIAIAADEIARKYLKTNKKICDI